MPLKHPVLAILLVCVSLFCKAQFYFDFEESRSFYKKNMLVRQASVKTESIVVKQLKDKVLEDSFKIVVTSYNSTGNPVSTHTGSKWTRVALADTIEYNAEGGQLITSQGDKTVMMPLLKDDVPNLTMETYKYDTVKAGVFHYEYDTVRRVKKVFFRKSDGRQLLAKLVFYDGAGRIVKIDYAPESEKINYADYRYKKNKLKIYTVTKNGELCNDRLYFNDEGQVIKREVDFRRMGMWVTNTYYYTYNEFNLLQTEKKVSDGKVYTEVIHSYQMD